MIPIHERHHSYSRKKINVSYEFTNSLTCMEMEKKYLTHLGNCTTFYFASGILYDQIESCGISFEHD